MDEQRKTVALTTLGCKMNQAETEALREAFAERGWRVVPFRSDADVYIVNTCTVTGKTDHQCRQVMRTATRRRQENPNALVVATGCYAQTNPDGIRDMVEGVALIAGNNEKSSIPELVEQKLAAGAGDTDVHVTDIATTRTMQAPLIQKFTGLTRAFLRVQDGCSHRCAYCIIPTARGPARSLPMDRALEQARTFTQNGHREIVVTGIHVGRYGRDLSPKTSLAQLLRALHHTPGLDRIRLSSIEPGEFTPELFEALEETPNVCPHFHISLQSGDDRILKLMRRTYRSGLFADVVAELRRIMPDVCVGADVIVGFPSEDEESFRRTCDFVQEVELSYLHIFRYSVRPGTEAADMPDHVQEEIKKNRSVELREIRTRLNEKFRKRFAGRTMDTLFEHRRTAKGQLTGLTANYLRVTLDGPDQSMGRILPVHITELTRAGVTGQIQNPE